jgi:hypothetical protein
MINQKVIQDELKKAYKEAGHNAYFSNGFLYGVKFAENYLRNEVVDKAKELGLLDEKKG